MFGEQGTICGKRQVVELPVAGHKRGFDVPVTHGTLVITYNTAIKIIALHFTKFMFVVDTAGRLIAREFTRQVL